MTFLSHFGLLLVLTLPKDNRYLPGVLPSRSDRDSNILSERNQKIIKRSTAIIAGAVAPKRRDMRLLDSQYLTGFSLREAEFLDVSVDLQTESSFELPPFRIGKTEARKHIAALSSVKSPQLFQQSRL